MVSIIKDICIFMIIAQAILFFVPGSSYGKYVRLLVGIMMILQLTQPLFQLLTDEEERRRIADRVAQLEQAVSAQGQGLVVEDNRDGIARAIEQELKEKLEECDSGYRIQAVALDQDQGRVVVTVRAEDKAGGARGEIRIEPVCLGEKSPQESARQEGAVAQDDAEKERLQRLCGQALGVEEQRVEIVLRQEGG